MREVLASAVIILVATGALWNQADLRTRERAAGPPRTAMNLPRKCPIHLGSDMKEVRFHSTRPLSNGMTVGKLGALQFLVVGGVAVSCGFHSITPTTYGYVATLGAARFELDRRGQIVTSKRYDL
ncbi:hypothetical protein HY968_04010 [Candidatus Kaiserbacteria bacterium]|nr:hypothetical protein [Candidatus Kaiserbacteria bacterium]